MNLEPKYPATDRPRDLAATRRADAYMNRQFLDPVFLGRYPEELVEMHGAEWPAHPAEDFDLIRQPLDFLGINYYTRSVTAFDPAAEPLRAARVRQHQHIHTTMDWEVYPPALTDVLLWVRNRYGSMPLYITENGAAFADPPEVDGPILDDPLRVAYLRDHLRAAYEAVQRLRRALTLDVASVLGVTLTFGGTDGD